MHESILRKIVGKLVVARKFAQEIPHVRLVAANQLAKRPGVLAGNNLRDEELIDLAALVLYLCFQGRDSLFPIRHITR